MSSLAVLAAGVTFACSATGYGAAHAGDIFTVFAPAERTFEEYRVSGPEESYFNPGQFELVEDSLPERLLLTWRRENNSPVSLTVKEHDAAKGTARFSLSTESNPSSALFTPIEVNGTCVVRKERQG